MTFYGVNLSVLLVEIVIATYGVIFCVLSFLKYKNLARKMVFSNANIMGWLIGLTIYSICSIIIDLIMGLQYHDVNFGTFFGALILIVLFGCGVFVLGKFFIEFMINVYNKIPDRD